MDSKNGYLLRGNRGDSLRNLTVEEYCTIGSIKPKGFYKHYPNKFFDGRNYSREFLENEEIFFSDPKSFDDPYDCDCFFDDNKLRENVIIRLANNYGIKCTNFKSQYGILEDIIGVVRSKSRKEKADDVSKNHITFVVYQTILDSNYSDTDSEIAKRLYENLIISFQKPIEAFKRLRVACFTNRNDSIPMWSFYSDNHRGFCVEYEMYSLVRDLLIPVIYSNERVDISDTIGEMIFKAGKNLDIHSLKKAIMFTILHKSMEWQTQNEWRLVLTPEYLENNNPLKVGRIKKVFLGAKMPEHEQEVITEICRRKGYECYKMELEKIRYALTPKKLF